MLCCATFPLIWAGGLVTTYDAGMAVPDWPSTFGYNLWLYPWSTWVSGPWDLFIEHGHRLLGTLVGILAIAFVFMVYRFEQRLWMRTMAWICLAGVLLQGALGGARVLLDDRQLAMIHGCVGPSFFAFCAALAVMTSRYWREAKELGMSGTFSGLHRLSVLTASLVFVQLLLGAQIRHISIMSGPGVFRAFVFFHLIVAAALLIHAVLLAAKTLRTNPHLSKLSVPAVILAILIGLQFVLGPATWIVTYGWPTWLAEMPFAAGYIVHAKGLSQAMVVTAHVAVGSLVLANSVVVVMRSFRLVRVEATTLGSTAVLVGLAT
jgi:cytochrome c oxidase assembly protein subunit 15